MDGERLEHPRWITGTLPVAANTLKTHFLGYQFQRRLYVLDCALPIRRSVYRLYMKQQ